jgi:recombinational DNA repair ATPase RecF
MSFDLDIQRGHTIRDVFVNLLSRPLESLIGRRDVHPVLEDISFSLNKGDKLALVGENGSGKTSLLEAIHYLILGRSFRSHLVRRIIKYNANSFSIFGKFDQGGNQLTAGVMKSTKSNKKVKIKQKPIH